jgi:predicted nuclease of restriction endonuclease-like (RecB) superfamily
MSLTQQTPKRLELNALRADGQWMPDMVFRDPYILDFLSLSDSYSEQDLETAILRDIEAFLLEMGGRFSFVTRQRRMVIDGEVHTLDLLFYHRRLRRLKFRSRLRLRHRNPSWNRLRTRGHPRVQGSQPW